MSVTGNFPGPWEVEIKYTTGVGQHTMRINCEVDGLIDVGDAVGTINLKERGGTIINLDVAVVELAELLKIRFNASVNFDNYNLWKYDDLSYNRTWYATNVLGINGTSPNPTIPANQLTYTHRTKEGGIMRLVLLETTKDSNVREPYSSLGIGDANIMDYVTKADTWVLGRDTSPPIAPLNLVGGQNEKLFKQRFR